VKCAWSLGMARGIPGSPPPVPISKTLSPVTKAAIFMTDRYGTMWRSITFDTSFRDMRLIFEFHWASKATRNTSPTKQSLCHPIPQKFHRVSFHQPFTHEYSHPRKIQSSSQRVGLFLW
jgi:hypothetical protein